jgi:hypothetical protein
VSKDWEDDKEEHRGLGIKRETGQRHLKKLSIP